MLAKTWPYQLQPYVCTLNWTDKFDPVLMHSTRRFIIFIVSFDAYSTVCFYFQSILLFCFPHALDRAATWIGGWRYGLSISDTLSVRQWAWSLTLRSVAELGEILGGSAVLSVNYFVQNVVYKLPLWESLFYFGAWKWTDYKCKNARFSLTYRCDMLQQRARSKQWNNWLTHN